MHIGRAVAIVGLVALSFTGAGCGGSPSAPSVAAPAQSVLTFVSQPGDFIGGGLSYQFTVGTATFHHDIDPAYPGSIVIRVVPNDLQSFWFVWMGAPTGQELKAGSYVNAAKWTTAMSTQPRFTLDGAGRICTNSEAQFSILELTNGAPVRVSSGDMVPTIQRLHVQFTQRCTSTSAPGLTGELWYIATP